MKIYMKFTHSGVNTRYAMYETLKIHFSYKIPITSYFHKKVGQEKWPRKNAAKRFILHLLAPEINESFGFSVKGESNPLVVFLVQGYLHGLNSDS